MHKLSKNAKDIDLNQVAKVAKNFMLKKDKELQYFRDSLTLSPPCSRPLFEEESGQPL